MLLFDVKAAVLLLIVPNTVMAAIQFTRTAVELGTRRRPALALVVGAVGTVVGTRLLVLLPPAIVLGALGALLLIFVALDVAHLSPRIPPGWEPWIAPVVGLVTGVVGGITNVPGTPMAVYVYGLGVDRREFVRAVGFSFVVYMFVYVG